ncbi:hypothetical protein [Noviherbaspirillum pedocola]|uniref:Uncharacterized protein n=1 Tax=Noviherbaspirillum pedocola TaxID=2801341 RepID=A0A934SX79_9BURK|nr:hypothetical protein [Noviherbaspirillum pedocola]MBK4737314.1 hypothetical protein [Noviherbaspirillum pedocola]
MRYGMGRKRIVGASLSAKLEASIVMCVFYGAILIVLAKVLFPWDRMFFAKGQRCMNYWNPSGLVTASYTPNDYSGQTYIQYQIEQKGSGYRRPANFYHACVFNGWSVDAQATDAFIKDKVQDYIRRCDLVSEQLRFRESGVNSRLARRYDATPAQKAAWRAEHCTASKGAERAELRPQILDFRDKSDEF